jgi:hypothetical protein
MSYTLAQAKGNATARREGGPLKIRNFPVASSQTFKKGDWVTLTSGQVAVAVAAGSNLAGGTKVLGMAWADAPTTTNAQVTVVVADDSTEFAVAVYHATPASAVTAVAQIGTSYELRNDSTGGSVVDIGSTTNTKVQITGFADEQPNSGVNTVGVAYAPVWVKVLAAQRVF